MASDDYLRFNTQSISELIRGKLEEDGIDISRGSSAQIITDVVSNVFELLQFQLNRNVANSTFSKTQDLQSIISQAKLLGYNPIGYQAGQVYGDITLIANLDNINYVIPRYSYTVTSAGRFSLEGDLSFANDFLPDDVVFGEETFKQGNFVEHPLLNSNGNTNQSFRLSTGNNTPDHNCFDVYVRESGGSWEQWERQSSLFLSGGTEKHFELRWTGNTYELVFGDCVNGYIPPDGAEIAIYYLNATNSNTTLVAGAETESLVRFSTTRLNQILSDLSIGNKGLYINDLKSFFVVTNSSTNFARTSPETVEDIRRNAPQAFQTQNRLVTASDYQSFIQNNFGDFVADVKVLDNQEYLDTYMAYFYGQGLDNPLLESRSLYNQLTFADCVNFNNVWIFLIPKTGNFVTDVQKQFVIDRISDLKTLTAEICPADPIYIEYAVATPLTTLNAADIPDSSIRVVRSTSTNRTSADIGQEVYQTIVDYFSERTDSFGNLVDVNQLNTNVLNIDGVQEVYTVNAGVELNGIQFYSYNPQFPERVTSAPPTSQFEQIFVPRLLDNNLTSRILVV